MDMASLETSSWFFDYGLVEDIPFPAGEFVAPATDFGWPFEAINVSPDAISSVEVDCSSGDSDGSRKRPRSESSCDASYSKARREKLQRERLNERFLELLSILDPGRLPKTDKAAILTDAVRALTQLRSESKKLKASVASLQANIKELKAEKSELRDEKKRLRVDREKLEQQVVVMSAQNGFLPHPPATSTAFAVRMQASGNKLMPFISYPGDPMRQLMSPNPDVLMPFISYPGTVPMRQLMSPNVVDTSQDHILRPPVA